MPDLHALVRAVSTRWPPGSEKLPEVQAAFRDELARFVNDFEGCEFVTGPFKSGAGAVICAGGLYLASAYVTVRALNHLGWRSGIEIWHLPGEVDEHDRRPFEDLGVVFREGSGRTGWHLKPWALRHSAFRHCLFLDADCYPVSKKITHAFIREYHTTGAVFFPDSSDQDLPAATLELLGVPGGTPSQEAGILYVDTVRHWLPLELAQWMNDRSDYYYRHFWGDKESYHLAWRRTNSPFTMASRRWCRQGPALVHFDELGAPLAVHRVLDKYKVTCLPQYVPELPLEEEGRTWLAAYRQLAGAVMGYDAGQERRDRTPPAGVPAKYREDWLQGYDDGAKEKR